MNNGASQHLNFLDLQVLAYSSYVLTCVSGLLLSLCMLQTNEILDLQGVQGSQVTIDPCTTMTHASFGSPL